VAGERVAVLGGGSWGTALANHLAISGHSVSLWVFEPDVAEQIRATKVNRVYLPEIKIADSILVTNRIDEAVDGRQIIVSMGPSAFARSVCSQAAPHVSADAIILNAAKGLEPQTLKRMSEVMEETFPQVGPERIATLSGPTFAQEVAKRRPTAAVVASRSQSTALRLQKMLHSSYFRPYTSPDIIGVEFGGALKNIVAIASGIVAGLGLGPNTQAALITRGLWEITRLGVANGARAVTFQGLSGMGDLVLTCTSRLSRNFSVGFQLAQGRALRAIVSATKMVAEGIGTTRAAVELARKCNVEMPIAEQIFLVLFSSKPPAKAIEELMSRPLKEEMSWKV